MTSIEPLSHRYLHKVLTKLTRHHSLVKLTYNLTITPINKKTSQGFSDFYP